MLFIHIAHSIRMSSLIALLMLFSLALPALGDRGQQPDINRKKFNEEMIKDSE